MMRRIKARHVSGQDLDVMVLIENVFNAKKEWMVCVDEPGDGSGGDMWSVKKRKGGGGGGDGDDGKEKNEMPSQLVVCVLMAEADGAEECDRMRRAAESALLASRQPSTTGGEAREGVRYIIDLGDEAQSQGGGEGGGASCGGGGGKERARRSSQSSRGACATLKAAILTSECAGYSALMKGMDSPLLVFWKS